jgi:hypothetical protein
MAMANFTKIYYYMDYNRVSIRESLIFYFSIPDVFSFKSCLGGHNQKNNIAGSTQRKAANNFPMLGHEVFRNKKSGFH